MVINRIKIDCSNCGQALEVKPSSVGKPLSCPKCKHKIVAHKDKIARVDHVPDVMPRAVVVTKSRTRLPSTYRSSMRDERIFFRLLVLLLMSSIVMAFGFTIGRQYAISQVETAREAGMKINYLRNPRVKKLFDSFVGKPDIEQTPGEGKAELWP